LLWLLPPKDFRGLLRGGGHTLHPIYPGKETPGWGSFPGRTFSVQIRLENKGPFCSVGAQVFPRGRWWEPNGVNFEW